MTIKEIKIRILGKTISYYDGFSGSHKYFIVKYVKNAGNSITVTTSKDQKWGIYIPKKYLKELLDKGIYIQKDEIERCPFELNFNCQCNTGESQS